MTEANPLLAEARNLAANGRLEEAAAAYRSVQDAAPLEAADFLGAYALRRQRWAEAVEPLERAARLAPGNATMLENLGLAYERVGALEKAGETLQLALDARPDYFVSRLLLGFVEQRLGRALTGFAHMQWAFHQARQRGYWRDTNTTQPWLRQHVREASGLVARYPQDLLLGVLRRVGAGSALPRVEAFIRSQLGLERHPSSDPRQQPKTHYFPELPPSPWLDSGLFPWARRLQEAFPQILEEYLSVAGANSGFESFLTFESAEQLGKYLGTTGPAPEWNAFFFYRHGVRNDENCARCPRTAALIDDLPLIKLPGTTPEVCFSVLTPGSHILPHRGDANLRSVVHLGLVVPHSCALSVAGEARNWQPGGLLAFDDTYEHEAWNRSDSVRAVLLMDAWNPYLTEDEKRVLPEVIGAMGQLVAEAQRVRPATP